jgi:hypothetical protein
MKIFKYQLINLSTYQPPNSREESRPIPIVILPLYHMAYSVPPIVNAPWKRAGWFLGLCNASAYAPAVRLEGGTALREGVVSNSLSLVSLPSPLNGILY